MNKGRKGGWKSEGRMEAKERSEGRKQRKEAKKKKEAKKGSEGRKEGWMDGELKKGSATKEERK